MLMRRRMMMAEEDEEMKEWQVLLDQVVEDNNIFYYTVDAQGCKEFYVSVFFANDPEITSAINGRISLNATGSPWGTGTTVSSNISCIPYVSSGNNNKAVVIRFEVIDGMIIPKMMAVSANTTGSSNNLVPSSSSIGLMLSKSSDNNALSYTTVDEIKNISVGSYTKYFGVGSKILILGK